MNNQHSKNIIDSKYVTKWFFITIFFIAAMFSEFLIIIQVLSPKTAIVLFDSLGMKKAIIYTQELLYERHNKPEDLYNLILSVADENDNDKILKYTQIMLNREDFERFSEAFDNYAIEHSRKDSLYLVASLKNYLMGLRVEAMYSYDEDKAFQLACECFLSSDISQIYFINYIDSILADPNLSEQQKMNNLATAANAIVGNNSVLNHIIIRYNNNLPQNLENSDLLLLQQLWQLKKIQLVLSESLNLDEISEIKQDISYLAELINNKRY